MPTQNANFKGWLFRKKTGLIIGLIAFLPVIVCAQSIARPAIQLFVSSSGNDNNSGTINKPLASLNGARNAVRKLSDRAGVTVFLRGGTYQFNESCAFSGLDSGYLDRPVIYRNYGNEKVIFNGGIKLNTALFKRVSDVKIITRLPENARNKVVQIDLKKNGIVNYGKLTQHGFAIPVQPAPLELFFNQKPLTRARWPNNGVLQIGDVIDPGSDFRAGDTTARGARFAFNYTRARRWKSADNSWISGFFSNSWADDNLQIDSIDLESRTMKLVQPHMYSVLSSSTDKDHLRGFYVYNLLEEIDQPGEWFLDERSGILYVWPPASLSNQTIEVSLLSQPFIEMVNTANITFEGITFECSRGMGIFINNSKHCAILHSVFRNLGTVAISTGSALKGGKLRSNADGSPKREDTDFYDNEDILIDHCLIYNVGTGGIILTGGNRQELTAGNNVVQNCEIYNFSRINNTYSPAVDLNGVGNAVKHCYIHDCPHEALSFLGNNHLIEFNHFKNLCTGAHDMGAVYTGRDPSCRGTSIRYNFFENIVSSIGGSVCSIYMDDGSGGINVQGNVFSNASTAGRYGYGAVFIHGGGDNFFTDNVFINCELAFGNTAWGDKKWKEYITSPLLQKRLLKDVNIHSAIYQKNYPELSGFTDTLAIRPRINRSVNSVFYGKGRFSAGSGYIHKDSLISTLDPGFADLKKGDFRFKNSSIVFRELPDFRPIPFDRIGIQTRRK